MALAQAVHVAHPRPYATYYYTAVRHADSDWSKVGRASTTRGAIRAAVGHIIDRKYVSCIICDHVTGVVIVRVFRKGNTISIIGDFGHGN